MSRGTRIIAAALFLSVVGVLFTGCDRGESAAYAQARELERKLLMKGGEITYADPAYLPVARELNEVQPWSSDYAKAQEKLSQIKAARRLQLNETHKLGYVPTELAQTSLASLAPPQLDKNRPVTRPPMPLPPPVAPAAQNDAPALPPGGAQGEGQSAATSSAPAAAAKAGKVEESQVILYSTSWCGYCRRARAYFNQKGVAFVEKDVERDAMASREVQNKTGGYSGVPVIDIDGTIIQGFDIGAIERALQQRKKG